MQLEAKVLGPRDGKAGFWLSEGLPGLCPFRQQWHRRYSHSPLCGFDPLSEFLLGHPSGLDIHFHAARCDRTVDAGREPLLFRPFLLGPILRLPVTFIHYIAQLCTVFGRSSLGPGRAALR